MGTTAITVTLYVTNTDGSNSIVASETITASDTPPSVSLTMASTIPLNASLVVTASGSDPNGDGVTYAWTYPPDMQGTLSGTGGTVSFIQQADVNKTYTISVVATDKYGLTATASSTVTVMQDVPSQMTATGLVKDIAWSNSSGTDLISPFIKNTTGHPIKEGYSVEYYSAFNLPSSVTITSVQSNYSFEAGGLPVTLYYNGSLISSYDGVTVSGDGTPVGFTTEALDNKGTVGTVATFSGSHFIPANAVAKYTSSGVVVPITIPIDVYVSEVAQIPSQAAHTYNSFMLYEFVQNETNLDDLNIDTVR